MKDWCLQHPYLTFFIIVSVVSTIGNVLTKLIDVFTKPATNVVNMTIDPTKMPGFNPLTPDDVVH